MSSPGLFPVNITQAGVQPTSPAVLRAQLIALVAATNPGYTSNLPGSLIEDIASTDTGALIVCDQARVELLNSLTAIGSNAFLLFQLGQLLGIPVGAQTNTSVYVVFSDAGAPGFVIARGFTVSDGVYQYVVQDGGALDISGNSAPLFCLATIQGSWAVPAGTVTQLVTSPPPGITLTVTNPNAGLPGVVSGETEASYRSRVFQGNLAGSQGTSRYLKTLLGQVSGVQPRLVSALAQAGSGWLIMVGGGDPYEVANAVFTALFDVSTLVGSTINVTAVSNASPGKVTCGIAHGLITGQANVYVLGCAGITMPSSGGPYTVTVTNDYQFTIGTDTTSSGAWTSGGVVTPNARNVSVSISDYPNSYNIPIVVPLVQTVTMTVTWNTTSANYVSAAAVAQLGGPAIAAYINSIPVGLPINLFELQETFQLAIASVLSPVLLTRMVFAVSIDGVGVSPTSGTGIIPGDTQSYLTATLAGIVISKG